MWTTRKLTDDVKVIARSGYAVPECTVRIRGVEYEREELYEAYSKSSDDGDSGKDDGEI